MKLAGRRSRLTAALSPRSLSTRSRRLTALALMALTAFVIVASSLGAGKNKTYKVRAVFVSAAAITHGADVRVGGANVGSVEGIWAGRDGLASVVLNIKNPAFRAFYNDGNCRIRLQSLIGEKFVDCQPGSPDSGELPVDPADPKRRIMPHDRTSSPIDPDELLNAMRQPQRERFRVIINELGVTLTGRGQDLQDILDRFNPTMMNVNKVLKILAKQNRDLEKMAVDGDQALIRLARARKNITGMMRSGDQAARAVNTKQEQLSATLNRMPAFLRELELTAPVLKDFADQSAPVAASARAASGDLSEFVSGTKKFVDAANPALTRFGQTADVFRAQIPALLPVADTLREIGKHRSSVRNMNKLLTSFDKQGGYGNLAAMAVGLVAAGNGSDSFGHFMRSAMVLNGICFNYVQRRNATCAADFASRTASNSEPGKTGLAPTVSAKAASDLAQDSAALDYLMGGD